MSLATRPPTRHRADPAELELRLEQTFRRIATTRMAGVPVLNPALQVRALGFAPLLQAVETSATTEAAPALLGILLTPWFMNLLRVPAAGQPVLPVGISAEREVGAHRLSFVGAHEPSLGAYEQCSLFSPMFQFADQAAAVATAREVLRELRRRPDTAAASAPSAGDGVTIGAAGNAGGARP